MRQALSRRLQQLWSKPVGRGMSQVAVRVKLFNFGKVDTELRTLISEEKFKVLKVGYPKDSVMPSLHQEWFVHMDIWSKKTWVGV